MLFLPFKGNQLSCGKVRCLRSLSFADPSFTDLPPVTKAEFEPQSVDCFDSNSELRCRAQQEYLALSSFAPKQSDQLPRWYYYEG